MCFFPEEVSVVSIYDEFDDGLFGKSIHRGVIVSVKKSAFARAETLPVKNEDDMGYLTAVVINVKNAERLINGFYELPFKLINDQKIYTFNKEGLIFDFSIEKANNKIIHMVEEHYKDDEVWRDPLIEYYKDNYIIRIHSAENVFDSWSDEITYNEAMVVATLIGDSSQWLWGIHDGSDILNNEY